MSSNGLKEVKNITEVYKTITPKSGYGQLQEVKKSSKEHQFETK